MAGSTDDDSKKTDLKRLPPGGCTLREAAKAYSGPGLWIPYEWAVARLRKFRRTPTRGWVGGGMHALEVEYEDEKEWKALISERDHAKAKVTDFFLPYLCSGKLTTVGIVPPLAPDSVRVLIPSWQWSALDPDYEESTATGGGVEYVCVYVYEWDKVEAASVKTPASARPGPDPEDYRKRRKPGRPPYLPAVKDELRNRAKRGELLTPKTAEFEYLADWAEAQFQGIRPPSKVYIQKQLGRLYDELIGTKKTDN